ncbi:hypothetical protein AKO1_004460 [Acrasis kona]|uniref:Uncharacterized protein n=1 Tax=Acrasis kona TaxID=1008807 RepID=A0AAW2YST0_9EUKA
MMAAVVEQRNCGSFDENPKIVEIHEKDNHWEKKQDQQDQCWDEESEADQVELELQLLENSQEHGGDDIQTIVTGSNCSYIYIFRVITVLVSGLLLAIEFVHSLHYKHEWLTLMHRYGWIWEIAMMMHILVHALSHRHIEVINALCLVVIALKVIFYFIDYHKSSLILGALALVFDIIEVFMLVKH